MTNSLTKILSVAALSFGGYANVKAAEVAKNADQVQRDIHLALADPRRALVENCMYDNTSIVVVNQDGKIVGPIFKDSFDGISKPITANPSGEDGISTVSIKGNDNETGSATSVTFPIDENGNGKVIFEAPLGTTNVQVEFLGQNAQALENFQLASYVSMKDGNLVVSYNTNNGYAFPNPVCLTYQDAENKTLKKEQVQLNPQK